MKFKKILKTVAQVVIYLAVGYFIYDKLNGNLDSVLKYEVFSYKSLLFATLFFSLNSIFNALNWHRLMELVGEKTPLMGQTDIYLRSFLLRYIPGNVVGILSRGIFNKKYGISQVRTLWCWFIENIIYLLWAIVIGSYIVLKNIAEIAPLFDLDDRKQIVVISVLGLIILLCIAIALASLLKLEVLESIFRKFALPQLQKAQKTTYRKIELSPKGRLEIFIRYGLAWLIPSIAFLLVVYGLVGSPIDRPLELVSANALAYAIGYIVIITPSGGGVREAILISLLTTINGFSPSEAVVIAIATRVVFILGELLSFGIFYPVFGYYNLLNRKK